MTEKDWLATESIWPLWHAAAEAAGGIVPERVKRRAAAYACRRVEHLMADPASRAMIAASDDYLEGRLTQDQLAIADRAAFAVADSGLLFADPTPARLAAHAAAWLGPDDSKLGRAIEFATEAVGLQRLLAAGYNPASGGPFWDHPEFVAGREAEERRLADPFRDIAGRPGCRDRVADEWRTPTALALAARVGGNDWSVLPVLADALEDAGCDAAELLAHLRGPGSHVRGCWALDAIHGIIVPGV